MAVDNPKVCIGSMKKCGHVAYGEEEELVVACPHHCSHLLTGNNIVVGVLYGNKLVDIKILADTTDENVHVGDELDKRTFNVDTY